MNFSLLLLKYQNCIADNKKKKTKLYGRALE